jgi:uncharacterized protein
MIKQFVFNRLIISSLLVLVMSLFSCSTNERAVEKKVDDYSITTVDIHQVKLTDSFWLPLLKKVQEITIPYALKKCEEEGRYDNFLIAGGKMEGETKGAMPFDDSDVYKIIEGAAISLMSFPNKELEQQLDSIIEIVSIGQEADGYITTWRTINPAKPPATWVNVVEGKRWESLNQSHELYNAGHMYEAAAAHYWATGKRNFLDIALKNADFIVKTFGDGEGQIKAVPGHQIIETGLVQLFRITGEEKYLNLAKYFLDNRGNPNNHKLYGDYISMAYTQDHKHPTKQKQAVGHAVRAEYMYAGMTDIAVLKNDSAYKKAVENLWENVTYKKTYITGGIGALHKGEAFGDNYELPNKTAYNETCAAIGSVCWNDRLFRQSGDVVFYDVIERTLYNGLISGISLDGTHFFYPNPLEADGKYEFNQGACTRKNWFDCSCCPTNLIRFLPTVPKYIYAKKGDTLYTNLYISNSSEIELENNEVSVKMETEYPWKGKVTVSITSTKDNETTLKFRIPGWVRNEPLPGDLYFYENQKETQPKVLIDGESISPEIKNGYLVISKNWKNGGTVEIKFPMEVKLVKSNDKVAENKNKVAIEYGPIVYAIEEIDNKDIDNISFDKKASFKVEFKPDLLGGVNTVATDNLAAIPYFAWSNRGVGKMKVWLDLKE